MKQRKIVLFVALSFILALGFACLTACKSECKHSKMIHHEMQEATCVQTGTGEYWECPDCDKLFSDAEGKNEISEIPVLEKTEHKWKTTFEKDADGHWLECSVCSAKTEKTAHTEEVTEATDSTCVTHGMTEGRTCSVCGYVIVAPEEKPFLPHEMTYTPAKAPNCQEKGNSEYWYCSSCQTYYTDENGEHSALPEELEIAADPDAHVFGDWVEESPQGCGISGTKAHKDCLICGKHFDADGTEIDDLVIPADEHNFTSLTVTAPTKTVYNVGDTLDKTGLTVTAHCSNCGEDPDVQFTVDDENRELVKGVNSFTVRAGALVSTFSVSAYQTQTVAQNFDIMSTDTTAVVSASLFEGNVTALETAGQTATSGFTVSGDDITIGSDLITALKAGKTYGDFEVSFYTDAYIRYKITVSVITQKISSFDELNAIKATITGDTIEGYYILTADIYANNQTVNNFFGYTSNPQKGFRGIFDGRGYAIINPHFNNKNGIFGAVGQGGIVRNLAIVGATGGKDTRVLGDEIHGGTFQNLYIDGDQQYLMSTAWHSPTYRNIVFVSSAADASVAREGSTGTLTLENVFVVGSSVFRYFGETINKTNSQAFDSVEDLKAAVADGTVDITVLGDMWTARNNYPVMKSADAVHASLTVTNEVKNVLVGDTLQITVNINGATFSLKEPKTGITVSEDGLISVTDLTGNGSFVIIATVGGYSKEETFTYERGEEIVALSGYFANLEAGASTDTVDVGELAGVVFKIKVGDNEITEGFEQSGTTLTVTNAFISAVKGSESYGDFDVQIFTQDGDQKYRYDTTISVVTKKISSFDDLTSIRTDGNTLDGYFVVTQNFSADNAEAMERLIAEWSSSETAGFIGIFDGRGHVISNLKLKNGLFGSLGKCVIRNLALVNVTTDNASSAADGVLSNSDAKSAALENIFISTNAKMIYGYHFSKTSLKNVVFVTSGADSRVFQEGNNGDGGTCVMTNVIVCGPYTNEAKMYYSYYGGTPVLTGMQRFVSSDDMLDALESDNTLTAWDSPITYSDGAIYFNGVKVIENAA